MSFSIGVTFVNIYLQLLFYVIFGYNVYANLYFLNRNSV